MIDIELRAMVAGLQHEIANVNHVRIDYSDALTKVDLSRLELINAVDGWHPSVEGHRVWLKQRSAGYARASCFLKLQPDQRKNVGCWWAITPRTN
jgi:hypothetical protein